MKDFCQSAGASRPSISNPRGFTLIEVMIVVVVAAILIALAAPSFETLVYGSNRNRAVLELIADLQSTRLEAIRTQQNATVDFTTPAALDQYTVSWTENGLLRTRIGRIRTQNGRVELDPAPPGGSPAPDGLVTFTPMGFIQPTPGNATGNIYLLDTKTQKRTRILMTPAGAIEERQWNGAGWSGTPGTVP